ncbi:MAG: SMEK domain-containing protein [Lachnospiraceae bacterium]|nr:SMEK domain-containing protein [Lachnospiraceae bacterium]
MKESVERIQYISDYIVGYKTKIESLNRKGLFDTATLYEIFAQKICEIWFGQKFLNLNLTRANFPYVDLVSEDNKLYVQVSTNQNIPEKIKSTLEKIRDDNSGNLENVKKLYFFVLSNESVAKVRDYTGPSQIGQIAFTKKENLITTDDMIQRVKTDIEFQKLLYEFLRNESVTLAQIEEKFNEAILISKVLINNNFDYLINDEYEIDRTEDISKIREDNVNFISIQGEAGSGKSALCKKMLEDEDLVLFARADKISESRNLEDIWGLNIGKLVKYLKRKKLVIYIDALEFIADSTKTKFDLLQQIYETVKKHNNIYIITSCRSCDRTAFIKIENLYHIKNYTVDLLSDNQIIEISKKYSIIQDLWETKSYIQLLRSPFYLNLIVKKIKDFKKIDDVDGFRNLIWNDVMCMNGKVLPGKIKHSDVRKAIEKIVFDRAKKFLSGIKREQIGEEIVNLLQSENIIIACENDRVRLKYDIFEDICFERFIDNKFDDCKSDYDVFFDNLEDIGRCIYRRYQIWVENKLLSKANREKFLFSLLDTDKIPVNWKTQTIVGIMKSNFCSEFVDEYEYSISEELLCEFIKLTNIFAFEASICNLKYENVYSNLKPIGMGRPSLIKLIFKRSLYKKDENKEEILKLCSDYSMSSIYNEVVSNFACQILEYFVEERMQETTWGNHYPIAEKINECLFPIYRMAEYSMKWIKLFWEERISNYLYSNGRKNHVDEEIIGYVLKNTFPALVKFLPNELCEIADTYWIKVPEEDKQDYYYRSPLDSSKQYGLSRKADSYRVEYRHLYANAFIYNLITYNWVIALKWIIKLTNHAADFIKNTSPGSVYDINVWQKSPCDEKTFICNLDFWLAGVREQGVHELISDSIFLFTKMAVQEINSEKNKKEMVIKFAEYIKAEILDKANNIMMLSVISEIGRNCEPVIPGYSLFLASSIDLVMLDSQKMRLLMPNHERKLYEQLILMSVGIPEHKDRYNIQMKGNDSLQDYVLKMQLRGEPYRKQAETILDYLYSIIPNEGKFAEINLQIQKMDLRNATMSPVNDHTYAIIPEITGEAKRVIEENSRSKYNIERHTFQNIIEKCNSLMTTGKFGLQECLNSINQLKLLIEKADVPGQLQDTLVMIIAYALKREEMTIDKRSELCSIWIDGIERILNNGSFVFEINLVKILFEQVEFELDNTVKNKLKRQMLACLLDREEQGIIYRIACQLKEYLTQNESLAKCFFNTIIELSKDKMDCYKYNVSNLNAIGKAIDYQPNMKKPPVWISGIFREKRIELYQSRREDIIDKFLLQQLDKDLSDWNIEECDIQTLCYLSQCGLDLENADFKYVMGELYPYILSIISCVENYHEYLDVYAISEVRAFVEKELTSSHDISLVIDLLFSSIDYSKMNSDIYELYEDISSHMLTVYFDGYNNAEVRRRCEEIIKCMENKINSVGNEKARNRLYTMLFLTLGKFHMYDWNELPTKYSYRDKMFLNKVWSKYGWYHFKNLIYIIDQMHIKELLPQVLIPLNISLQKLKANLLYCEKQVQETETIINKIITKAFLDFNDEIKSDNDLTTAFENFLKLLVELNMEEAAVILDEFRIH